MSIDRISEQYIRNWLGKKRRKPLILRGARQVGKSTLARHFAANSGLTLNEVNLEKHFILAKGEVRQFFPNGALPGDKELYRASEPSPGVPEGYRVSRFGAAARGRSQGRHL